ncbi:hypothetical protein D7V94_07030 [Parablautia intestinalis]|jgi:uncharacterized protein with FMN-binding domain|uniref:FMN-binding protein n=1 Tax=Parablautia intestinalis TaxID=2320100 RepID=A0A3A9AYZ8_9FIRM|nr:hypothetical protein [Parablautia intestinalis]MCI8614085.1 hypothetical protein [Lachnospiraceae bacterium]MDE7046932.1 hypothetical protein [Lachnospiraceae bacterium]RKI92416.1 hypothetical protein D7V94_07030 [Parablautia intestinalis]
MSSKTKIVVLHLKELIYTGLFALLGILFIILLIIMFVPKDKKQETSVEAPSAVYVPGIYTTSLVLNDNAVDVEVTVDETNINDIRIVNLDEAVATMFPLLEPSFDELANQILKNQSLDNITYADDNKYTSMVLLNAIKSSLGKAAAPSPSESPSASPSPA